MNTTNDLSALEKAESLQQRGDLVNAEKFYLEALEQSPDSVKALANLAMLQLMKGDYQSAVSNWQKALSLDPNDLESLTNLGFIYSQYGDYQTALNYLESANQLAPKRDDICLQISQIRAHLGNTQGAKSILAPMLNTDPLSQNSYLMYAQLELIDGNVDSAKVTLEELLSKDPNLPEALVNLGAILEMEGKTEDALKSYQLAVEKAPMHFQANLELGRFLSFQRDLNTSLKYLQKAREIQPNHRDVHVHLGNLYQETGHFDQSIAAYKAALNLDPGNLSIRQNLSRVTSRFVPPWHLKMLADHERNDAFEGALKNMISEDTVALDIGTGSGLLAMMAARHGAKKVYACEQSTYIADATKENIIRNQLNNKIQLFQTKSTQLTNEHLPEKPNLIVAEIFDAGLLGEHAVPSFRHALENLCSDQARVIPRAAEVKGKLLHAPRSGSVNPIGQISGFDLSAFDQFRIPDEYITQNLSDITHEFCSDEFKILDVDFENLWPGMAANQCRRFEITIEVKSEKPIHGIAFWFNLFMDDQHILSSAPGRKDNHWGQAVSYFNQPLMARKGQHLKINVCYTDIKIWFEDPQLELS